MDNHTQVIPATSHLLVHRAGRKASAFAAGKRVCALGRGRQASKQTQMRVDLVSTSECLTGQGAPGQAHDYGSASLSL